MAALVQVSSSFFFEIAVECAQLGRTSSGPPGGLVQHHASALARDAAPPPQFALLCMRRLTCSASTSMPVEKAPRPVRESAAATLWASRAASDWDAALAAAPGRARATGVANDAAFYGLDMPARSASPPGGAHPIAGLTPADVVTTVTWKLARGTWRPRLLGFAEALTAGQVGEAAAGAAQALGGATARATAPPSKQALSAAIAALSELKGIGPATATALLAAADPSIPFLSDEASAVVVGNRDYSAASALALTLALRARAAELGPPWTARDVERALWSASRGPEAEGGDGGGGGTAGGGGGSKKRKKPQQS